MGDDEGGWMGGAPGRPPEPRSCGRCHSRRPPWTGRCCCHGGAPPTPPCAHHPLRTCHATGAVAALASSSKASDMSDTSLSQPLPYTALCQTNHMKMVNSSIAMHRDSSAKVSNTSEAAIAMHRSSVLVKFST